MIWETARGALNLDKHGVIMGIVNVTPDSFSDGGKYYDANGAIRHALGLLEDGAALVDIGGESTRPGAEAVTAAEERRRVLPVVEGLMGRAPGCLISVDTSKAEVARAALEAGAAIVNDVSALRGDPAMSGVVARAGAGVVLMHMQGTPGTMQAAPVYGDVVQEVGRFFAETMRKAVEAGISLSSIALDPGIGFGKTTGHNLSLLAGLAALGAEKRPLVVGVSRKSFLAKINSMPSVQDRLWATVALTALLRSHGARVFRVHDVRENLAALRAAEAVLGST